MAGSVAPAGELRMAGSMRSSDGSGVGKNSLGEIDHLDDDVVRDELTVSPVTTRFSRSNKIGHNNVDI